MIQLFTKRTKNNKGFTLVELIVVIAILGILVAIAAPRLQGFTDTAKKQADISNAKLIANMIYVAEAEGEINFSADGSRFIDGDGGVYNLLNSVPDVYNLSRHDRRHTLGYVLVSHAEYLKDIGTSELTGEDFFVRLRGGNVQIFVGNPLHYRNLVYPFPSNIATDAGDNWE